MKKREFPLLYDINVTNLVDVVLVLLIIFMIAAPMLQSGIDVSLPQSATRTKDVTQGVVITISKDNKIFVEDQPVLLKDLGKRLGQLKASKRVSTIYLRADKEVSYGLVVKIVGQIKKAGIEDLGLVTEEEI